MGIRTSERTNLFHVPYGSFNSEGTPENSFFDLRANPSWIPVLPSCIGWIETQTLLLILNASTSKFMSLASDQAFVEQGQPGATLTFFVTVCFADIGSNTKAAIAELVGHLNQKLNEGFQGISNVLQRSLDLDMVLEMQPTLFHNFQIEAWSLTILMAARGENELQARETWGLCLTMLGQAIEEYPSGRLT